jgi:hypothetical protein
MASLVGGGRQEGVATGSGRLRRQVIEPVQKDDGGSKPGLAEESRDELAEVESSGGRVTHVRDEEPETELGGERFSGLGPGDGVGALQIEAKRLERFSGPRDEAFQRGGCASPTREILEAQDGLDDPGNWREEWVERLFPKQEPDDLAVERELFGQERGVSTTRIGLELKKVVAEERRFGSEMRATEEPRGRGSAEHIQGEVNARPAAAHVIVEERVETLVPEVQLRCKGDQEDPKVEERQPEGIGQPVETRSLLGERVPGLLGTSLALDVG